MATVIFAIFVAALYFGRPVLVPVALAILLSFALAPLVEGLRRLRFGRMPSVLVAVLMAFITIGILGGYIGSQLGQLAVEVPRYQTNLVNKIHSLRQASEGDSVLQRAAGLFQALSDEILGASSAAPPDMNAPAAESPIPVRVVKPSTEPLQVIENIIGPLVEPLATTAIVIVFVIFILLQKEDLRDRVISLVGTRDMQRTTVALDETASRLSRFLLLQLILNASFGVIIGIGLWVLGIPNSGLWGLLAGILRFVPYVGIPLAALVPCALAIAVDPQWSMIFWVLGLFFGLEALIGQVVEPYVYGHNMGLSAIAVVVAATFWTWLWGPVGLLMATPLTMCLVVLGRHVEQLHFLDVLLGDRPPLAAEESFYLRMLASDPDEIAHQAELYGKEHPLSAYYDEVAMGALILAQKDASRGTLNDGRSLRVKETIYGLIANLSGQEEQHQSIMEAEPAGRIVFRAEQLAPDWRDMPVLCVAGRSALDEAAAALMVHLLARRGIGARVISAEKAAPNMVHKLEADNVQVIFVSYLDADNFRNAHYLIRRLRKRIPNAVPIAGLWGASHAELSTTPIDPADCELLVTRLRDGVDYIVALAQKAAHSHQSATSTKDQEPVSLA